MAATQWPQATADERAAASGNNKATNWQLHVAAVRVFECVYILQ